VLTGKQIRAARILTGWDANDLGELAKLSRNAVLQIERGEFRPRPATAERISRAFADAGIEFIENEGVRRRPDGIETFEGHERFHQFTDYVYSYLKDNGGDVCISVGDERLFIKYRKEPEQYRANMKALVASGKVRVRILAEKSNAASVFAEIRKLKSATAAPTSFYAFGRNLALISFAHQPPPYVALFRNSPFADAFRQSFETAWDNAEVMVKRCDH
jgi:transcriptional regulator with XRE-family HTH domain